MRWWYCERTRREIKLKQSCCRWFFYDFHCEYLYTSASSFLKTAAHRNIIVIQKATNWHWFSHDSTTTEPISKHNSITLYRPPGIGIPLISTLGTRYPEAQKRFLFLGHGLQIGFETMSQIFVGENKNKFHYTRFWTLSVKNWKRKTRWDWILISK